MTSLKEKNDNDFMVKGKLREFLEAEEEKSLQNELKAKKTKKEKSL